MCCDCSYISVLWLELHQCALIVFTSVYCGCICINVFYCIYISVLRLYLHQCVLLYLHQCAMIVFLHPCAVNVLTVCIRSLQVEASVLRVFQVIICPYPQCILYTMGPHRMCPPVQRMRSEPDS